MPYRHVFAGLLAVLPLLLAPLPAHAAAAPDPGLQVRFRDMTLAPGGSQGLTATVYARRTTPLTGAAVDLRLSGNLTGVLLLGTGTPGPCGQDASPTMHCDLGSLTAGAGPAGTDLGFVGYIGAGPDAVPGTVGTLSVTFTADRLTPITTTSVVRIGDSVDLDARAEVALSAPPGGPVAVPLQVRNRGTVSGTGSAILLRAPYAVAAGPRFRNCFYDGDQLRACVFDQELAPGTTYAASLPLRLRRDAHAPTTQYTQVEWMTGDEFADLQAFLTNGAYSGLGRPGAGGVLALTRTATVGAAAQADPDASNNTTNVAISVTGRNTVNLVAVGARLTGRPGDVVTAAVGVRNAGPATLDATQIADGAVFVFVAVPAGTTAVSLPDVCYPLIDGGIDFWNGSGGRPGQRYYQCRADQLLIAGRTQTFPVRLRIDSAAVKPGAVEVNRPCRGCENLFTGESSTSDNRAAITVTIPSGAAGAGIGGQGGGGLPITGPAPAAIAGAGLVLLLAGAAGVLLTRPRRTGAR
jgi:hypothetical protein